MGHDLLTLLLLGIVYHFFIRNFNINFVTHFDENENGIFVSLSWMNKAFLESDRMKVDVNFVIHNAKLADICEVNSLKIIQVRTVYQKYLK